MILKYSQTPCLKAILTDFGLAWCVRLGFFSGTEKSAAEHRSRILATFMSDHWRIWFIFRYNLFKSMKVIGSGAKK